MSWRRHQSDKRWCPFGDLSFLCLGSGHTLVIIKMMSKMVSKSNRTIYKCSDVIFDVAQDWRVRLRWCMDGRTLDIMKMTSVMTLKFVTINSMCRHHPDPLCMASNPQKSMSRCKLSPKNPNCLLVLVQTPVNLIYRLGNHMGDLLLLI